MHSVQKIFSARIQPLNSIVQEKVGLRRYTIVSTENVYRNLPRADRTFFFDGMFDGLEGMTPVPNGTDVPKLTGEI